MPEYAAEKRIRIATEREIATAEARAAADRASLEATIEAQAEEIATLKASAVVQAAKIQQLETKVDAVPKVP